MTYDVIVLGGGPGGYLAAERAGSAKLKVLCIEEKHLGGTCLNEGCVPTKTLLYSGKLYAHAKDSSAFGVSADHVSLDHKAVIDRKDKVVKKLVGGVSAAMKANHAEVLSARGVITGRTSEGCTVEAGGNTYIGRNLIIAAGSVTAVPPIAGLSDGLASGFVLTNREILDLRTLPGSLAILGGGVIGLEMATYFALAGVQTTVLEMLDHVGGNGDREMLALLQKNCESLGVTFRLGAKVTAVKDGFVEYELDGKTCALEAEKVLLSIGRRPNTEGLGLDKLGVVMDRSAVVTDEHMQTNIPGVYAVGDVNGKIMLAHTAYREAEVAVHHILGRPDRMRYDAIPSVLYTMPEMASVGETEESAKAKGLDIRVIKLPMGYSGRYLAETEKGNGICKMVFDAKRRILLGAQALCSYSSEFIIAAAEMIELELTADDISELVFPHPSMSEILREAACQL